MSDNSDNQISDIEKEALKFLERDFNQSFLQMRHYDQQILDVFKFQFTSYTGLVGVSLGLYQFGLKEGKDLRLPAVAAIILAIILGMFLFVIVVRNRVYFVQVTRYINEQRQLFFKFKPLGFINKSGMYTNPTLPYYFDWRSSQTWFLYIISFLNSVLLGVLLYVLIIPNINKIYYLIGLPFILWFLQLLISISYLKGRESNKTAEASVFGQKNNGFPT